MGVLVSGYPGNAETNPATARNDAVVATTGCQDEA
jgi:hypothetical protein